MFSDRKKSLEEQRADAEFEEAVRKFDKAYGQHRARRIAQGKEPKPEKTAKKSSVIGDPQELQRRRKQRQRLQ